MTLRLAKAALFIALPVIAVPAFAEPETVEDKVVEDKTEETKEEAEKKAEPKKICKRISADMSSRRKTRVCRTREQWKTFYKDQRRH